MMCSASASGSSGSASARASSTSPRPQDAREPDRGVPVPGILREHVAVARLGRLDVTGSLFGESLVGLDLHLVGQDLVDEPVDLLLRVGPDEHVDRLSATERHDRRDALALDRLQQRIADGVASTSSFASRNAPSRSAATFSRVGPRVRHGAHHDAHMSTTTGALRPLDHDLFEVGVGDVDHVLVLPSPLMSTMLPASQRCGATDGLDVASRPTPARRRPNLRRRRAFTPP